jgi:hypothetical protein
VPFLGSRAIHGRRDDDRREYRKSDAKFAQSPRPGRRVIAGVASFDDASARVLGLIPAMLRCNIPAAGV